MLWNWTTHENTQLLVNLTRQTSPELIELQRLTWLDQELQHTPSKSLLPFMVNIVNNDQSTVDENTTGQVQIEDQRKLQSSSSDDSGLCSDNQNFSKKNEQGFEETWWASHCIPEWFNEMHEVSFCMTFTAMWQFCNPCGNCTVSEVIMCTQATKNYWNSIRKHTASVRSKGYQISNFSPEKKKNVLFEWFSKSKAHSDCHEFYLSSSCV